jgi:hypothetical protein
MTGRFLDATRTDAGPRARLVISVMRITEAWGREPSEVLRITPRSRVDIKVALKRVSVVHQLAFVPLAPQPVIRRSRQTGEGELAMVRGVHLRTHAVSADSVAWPEMIDVLNILPLYAPEDIEPFHIWLKLRGMDISQDS